MTRMRCVQFSSLLKQTLNVTLPWLMCSFVIHGYICGCDWFWRWVELVCCFIAEVVSILISSVRLLPLGFSITSIFPSAFWLNSPVTEGVVPVSAYKATRAQSWTGLCSLNCCTAPCTVGCVYRLPFQRVGGDLRTERSAEIKSFVRVIGLVELRVSSIVAKSVHSTRGGVLRLLRKRLSNVWAHSISKTI